MVWEWRPLNLSFAWGDYFWNFTWGSLTLSLSQEDDCKAARLWNPESGSVGPSSTAIVQLWAFGQATPPVWIPTGPLPVRELKRWYKEQKRGGLKSPKTTYQLELVYTRLKAGLALEVRKAGKGGVR